MVTTKKTKKKAKPKEKRQAGRPCKFKEIQEVKNKIAEYFDSCWIDKVVEVMAKDGTCTTTNSRYQDRPYTVAGLALALDVCRDTLCEYEKNSVFSDAIKKAKLKIKMNVEERLLDGKNPAGSIFWLKNNDSEYYKDKQEIEHAGKDGGPIKIRECSDDELLAIIRAGAGGNRIAKKA